MSAGLIPVQIFHVRINHFLTNMYKETTLLKKFRHIALSKSSHNRCGRLYGMYVEMLLVLDTSAQRIISNESTLLHLYSRLRMFAAQTIGNKEFDGYF